MSEEILDYGMTSAQKLEFIISNSNLIGKYITDFKKITVRMFPDDEIAEFLSPIENLRINNSNDICLVGNKHFLSDISLRAMIAHYFLLYYSLILQYRIIDKYGKEKFPKLNFYDGSMDGKIFKADKFIDTFLISESGVVHDMKNVIFIGH